MSVPTCDDLKAGLIQMLADGGPVLIKAGDQLVKYTDIEKLKNTIEMMCGPIIPEGSTANRGLRIGVTRFGRRGGCGC